MLKHVSFLTDHPDAVVAFYTLLGASVCKDIVTAEGFRRLVLGFEGGGKLQFFQRPGQAAPERPDLGDTAWMEHVALHLPDLNASAAALKARGTTFTRDLTLSPSGTPMAFVLDPDGRQVELLQGE